jgi:hypothetical protein
LLRSVQSGSQFLQQSQQAIAQGIQQRHVTDEPTQFQRHLERLTGRWLPIYGMNFFTDALVMRSDGLRAVGPEFANPGDYELGVGDEVQLNLWGQVEASLSLLIDTQGHITLPKIGPFRKSRQFKKYSGLCGWSCQTAGCLSNLWSGNRDRCHPDGWRPLADRVHEKRSTNESG